MSVLQNELIESLESVSVPECANDDGSGVVTATSVLTGQVLARFAAFLAANAGLAPSKEVVLDMLSKAIDAAFIAINRPFIASLLKPIVKAQILTAAGNLYDSIFSAKTEV